MCLLQPTTTMPMTSPTTLTHHPTTTHLCFATTSTRCKATWTPLGDMTPAIQERQQWPNKIPRPRNKRPVPTKTTRPWLDARTQLKQHHWHWPRSLVWWPAPSTSPNSKRKAAMPNSLTDMDARWTAVHDGQQQTTSTNRWRQWGDMNAYHHKWRRRGDANAHQMPVCPPFLSLASPSPLPNIPPLPLPNFSPFSLPPSLFHTSAHSLPPLLLHTSPSPSLTSDHSLSPPCFWPLPPLSLASDQLGMVCRMSGPAFRVHCIYPKKGISSIVKKKWRKTRQGWFCLSGCIQ